MAKVYGGRWERGEEISKGGQGVAYYARDASGEFEGQWVLKRLTDARRLARFEREINILRSISHPNLLRVVDYSLDPNEAYYVSEFCEGKSLQQSGPEFFNDPRRTLLLLAEVSDGVAELHRNRIIHRDIKPGNIFLRGPNRVAVVGDPGIALVLDEDHLTVSGEVMGPRGFIAPELEGGEIDKASTRSDVYSIGKLTHWLLSGGKTLAREDFRSDNRELRFIRNDANMEHINRLLDRMICARPEDRLTSAIGLRQEFERLVPLITGHFRVPSNKIGSQCQYCGQGSYRRVENESWFADNILRYLNNSDARGRVIQCNACGHLQIFWLAGIDHPEWWSD